MNAEVLDSLLRNRGGNWLTRVLIRCEVSGAPYYHDVGFGYYDSLADVFVLVPDSTEHLYLEDDGTLQTEEEHYAAMLAAITYDYDAVCKDCDNRWGEESAEECPEECPCCGSGNFVLSAYQHK